MYDTIKIFKEGAICKDDKLSNVFERHDEGGLLVGGKLKNLDVKCGCRGLSVQGSLAKYHLPSNAHTLTRRMTQEAFECLSDDLGVDVCSGVCSRVDVGTIIETKKPPQDYFKTFGELPRFTRLQAAKETLMYKTQNRQFVIYDKAKEMLQKGNRQQVEKDLLAWGLGNNVMRLEARFLNLARSFKGGLLAKELYNEKQYHSFVREFVEMFNKIGTMKTIELKDKEIKTPKDAMNLFIAMYLQREGAETEIVEFIEKLKANKMFDDKKYYTRTKQGLFDLMGVNGCGMGNDDYKEIKEAVNEFAKYAR